MDSTTRRLLLAFGLFLVVALSMSALMSGMMVQASSVQSRPAKGRLVRA